MSPYIIGIIFIVTGIIAVYVATKFHTESNTIDRELGIPETSKSKGIYIPLLLSIGIVICLYMFTHH